MSNTIDPPARTAAGPANDAGPVTLINSFTVPVGREAGFLELWGETSSYFRTQPGFIAFRLHRALSPDASFRFVNIAEWQSTALFAAAHAGAEFKRLVSQPAWQEFPSRPALYEVAARSGAAGVAA